MIAYVRIRLDRSSNELLQAIANIVEVIDDADPVLLEDGVRAANEALKAALRGDDTFAFEAGGGP